MGLIQQEYFSRREAAKIFGVDAQTIDDMGKDGVFEVVYVRRREPRFRIPRTREEREHFRALCEAANARSRETTG